MTLVNGNIVIMQAYTSIIGVDGNNTLSQHRELIIK